MVSKVLKGSFLIAMAIFLNFGVTGVGLSGTYEAASAAPDCTQNPNEAGCNPFDPLGQACVGQPNAAACQESAEGQGEENPVSGSDGVIIRAANLIALATGVIAVVIIIIAGITTTLSAGDAGKIKSSRDAIIYAAVGPVVIALARTIVVFIVNRV